MSMPCRFLLGFVLMLATSARMLALTPEQTVRDAPWTVKQVGVGVTWKHYQFPDLFSAKQNIHVIDADLTQPDVMVRFPHLPGAARQPVSEHGIREGGAAAVVNGNYFDANGPVQFFKVDGQVLFETPATGSRDTAGIFVTADGIVRLTSKPSGGWASLPYPYVMATNDMLLSGGAPSILPNTPFYMTERHPRTVIGWTVNDHLLLVTIDGRQASTVAAGMTCVEAQTVLKGLGCWTGVNMDGGGSTTMWVRGEPGRGVVNHFSDATERPVANGVAIIAPALPSGPAWDARLTSYSCPSVLTSGQTAEAWIELRNYGAQPWTSQTKLGTLSPADRVSPFYTVGNWLAANRAAIPAAPPTPTGAVARFAFRLTAPTVDQTTLYNEDFGLTQDAVGWFRDAKFLVRFPITVQPSGAPARELIIESRSGGKNFACYSESGVWADAGASCQASGCTPGLGTRYGSTLRSVAGLKSAFFRPVLAQAGQYRVYAAWGAGSGRQGPILYRVTDARGTQDYELDQRATADQWVLLGTHTFNAGNSGVIEVNNSRVDATGNMYAGCIRLVAVESTAASAIWTSMN